MARQVQVLPSPFLGIGAGLGGIMSSYFEAKRNKKEAEIENVGRVFERATLTGDRDPLARLIEESPEAAEAFRARTGIDIFRMTIPEVGMPEDMPLEFPPEAPGMPVTEGLAMRNLMQAAGPGMPFAPGTVMRNLMQATQPSMPPEVTGAPTRELPPAVVSAPQPVAPTDVPWPVDPQGMQARATQEQIAGRELPEALQKPQPSPLATLTKDWGGIATTLEKLPTQRTKEAFMQAIEPHMPPGFPTEYTGDATEPPSPRDIGIMESKLYPGMTNDERHTWRTTGIAPFRSPTTPESEGMRMTISEFLRAYPHATDTEWVAFLESNGAAIPQKAPRFQTDKNTEVSLFNRSFEIAMLTGESQPEVYQKLVANTYESTEYLKEKKKTDEIRMLRMMLLDAYRVGDEKEAKVMLQRISTLTGIPYEPRKNIKEQILDFLRGTQKYSSSTVPELETESDFDRVFNRR